MISYGLKLRSTNYNLFSEANILVSNNVFDFIELYIVPGSFNYDLHSELAGKKTSFHAPHGMHGFDPIDPDCDIELIWKDLLSFRSLFQPFSTVIHPETRGCVSFLSDRLNSLGDKGILIENMPLKSSVLDDYYFSGFGQTDLGFLKNEGFSFCFDFAKAKSAAVSQGLKPLLYIDELIGLLNPFYFHVSGFSLSTEKDEHDDLWEGDYETVLFMKKRILEQSKKGDVYVVFECKKRDDLSNDVKNLNFLLSQ